MKIFVNKQHQIKAINSIDDSDRQLIDSGLLREIDINRQLVFNDMSDYMILSYCYREDEFGYSVYPAYNYDSILTRDNYLKIGEATEKISLLTQENEIQEGVIANLTYELMIMQYDYNLHLIHSHGYNHQILQFLLEIGYILLNLLLKS